MKLINPNVRVVVSGAYFKLGGRACSGIDFYLYNTLRQLRSTLAIVSA